MALGFSAFRPLAELLSVRNLEDYNDAITKKKL